MELIHKSTKLELGDFVKVIVVVFDYSSPLRSVFANIGNLSGANPKKEVVIGKITRFYRQKDCVVLSVDLLSCNKERFRGINNFRIRFRRDKESDYAYKLTKEEAVAELI